MKSSAFYQKFLNSLENKLRLRELSDIYSSKADYINFSTNDYLGFSNSKELKQAMFDAAEKYGVGSTGSRLLSGNSKLYKEFEELIAKDKKTEKAIIFNSGFQANISVLSSLMDENILGTKAICFFDKYNHSSLYQGAFLSGAELKRYRHNDIEHLAALLLEYQDDERPKFIVTETIFGMDGDIASLKEIVNLAKQYGAFLYLDEAHATGIIGEDGYGLSTILDLENLEYVIMGSFSKALGVCGAYIACSKTIRDYLVNKAAGFIYSTSLSPAIIGAAFKAWDKVRDLNEAREHLFIEANKLRSHLRKLGFNTGFSKTHIIPIILENEEKTLDLQEYLFNKKIIVSAIRPPTVPSFTSRIRIALSLSHSASDIEKLLEVLKKCKEL